MARSCAWSVRLICRHLAALLPHLRYHWLLAYLTPGGQAVQVFQRKVNTFFKPILMFTKGEFAGEWFGDVCRSAPNDNDKDHHRWGQSVSGMDDIYGGSSGLGMSWSIRSWVVVRPPILL